MIVGGEFTDEAERAVATALARTLVGVTRIELRPANTWPLAWEDSPHGCLAGNRPRAKVGPDGEVA
jgi:hypothetical protein